MTRLAGSASGPCFAVPHSPWPRLFTPQAPAAAEVALFRSLPCYFGQVRLLQRVHRRLRPPAFPTPAPATAGGDSDGDLPVPRRKASAHARVYDDAGPARISRSRHGPSRFLLDGKHQRRELVLRCSIPGLPHSPINARAWLGAGASSLRFHRDGLAPSTFRRSPGAPIHTISLN